MAAPCEFGNWQVAIDDILQEIEHSKKFRLFSQLTSNEERVRFIFQQKLLKHVKWLPIYFSSCKKWHGKSSEVARVWKNKGNKFFQQRKYADAIHAYTESCLHAPVKGEDLPIGYGNRSAALYHSGNYENCILDINRAVGHDFPGSSFHKLLARKTSALIKLGQKQDATQSFKVLKDFIDSDGFSLQEKRKDDFLKDVAEMQKLIENMTETAKREKKKKNIPVVSYGTNTVVSQASKAVLLTYTAEKGRHLLASRDIPKGSTVIVERPFAAVLLPDHYETHCHHCKSSLPLTAIGCQQCTTVRFCDEVCKDEAWSEYHLVECPYMDLFHSVGIAHLSLRIVLCAQLKFLTDFLEDQSKCRKSGTPADQGISQTGTYDRGYLTVYDLMTHEENTEPADMLQYSLTAALLLITLINAGFFASEDKTASSEVTNESLVLIALGAEHTKGGWKDLTSNMYKVGGLLLRHVLQLVCNAHAITSLQASTANTQNDPDNNTLDTEQVRVATAIYPTASLMNHSCDPTIISSFVGDVLVVRTVKDVEKGEEIYNCYGPHYCRMDRHERQEVLRTQYHFDCCCPPCSSGDISHDRFSALQCPICAGMLRGHSCVECGQAVDDRSLGSLRSKAEQAMKIFNEAIQLMNSQDVEGAINRLQDCQRKRQKILYKDHRDLALGEDAIARCYATLGKYSDSADYLFRSVKFAERMYGSKSVEFAHELQKLAEVLFNAGRMTECLKVTKQCLALFESLYAPEHEAVKQITELRDATQLALTPMMQAG